MTRNAMSIIAAGTVSHSARSCEAASFTFVEAVRFFAYRFFYYYFFGSVKFSTAQGAYDSVAMG